LAPAQQMPGELVESVEVLEDARLLDDENLGARAEERIELGGLKLGKALPLPGDWRRRQCFRGCWSGRVLTLTWCFSPRHRNTTRRVPMNKRHRIAVIAGDGIGKEVMPEGLRVLEAAGRRHGIAFQWDELPWSCDYYAKHGRMMPEDWFEQ